MTEVNEEFLKWMKEETKKRKLIYLGGSNEMLSCIVDLYNCLKKYLDNYYSFYKNDNDEIVFSYEGENYECSRLYGPSVLYSICRTSKKSQFDVEDVKANRIKNDELSLRLLNMKTVISDLIKMGIGESTINEQVKIYTKSLRKEI